MKIIGALLIFFAGYVWCDNPPHFTVPAAIGELEEIIVTAPRYIDGVDSVGTIPGIVVYGTRYEDSYENYRSRYLSLVNDITRYGGGALLLVFALTIIAIAWTKRAVVAHEYARRNRKEKSPLHDYYLRCQKKSRRSEANNRCRA